MYQQLTMAMDTPIQPQMHVSNGTVPMHNRTQMQSLNQTATDVEPTCTAQQLTMAMDTPIQPQMHTAGPPYVSPVPKDAACVCGWTGGGGDTAVHSVQSSSLS
jgi:hypothetical protein